MDNEKLAKAIVALYSVVSQNDDWDDTDEVIQNIAFQLFQKTDCPAVDFGAMLAVGGMNVNWAADFCDVPIRHLLWACHNAQAILSPVEVP